MRGLRQANPHRCPARRYLARACVDGRRNPVGLSARVHGRGHLLCTGGAMRRGQSRRVRHRVGQGWEIFRGRGLTRRNRDAIRLRRGTQREPSSQGGVRVRRRRIARPDGLPGTQHTLGSRGALLGMRGWRVILGPEEERLASLDWKSQGG